MGKLVYSTIASLDGYVEDASGAFEWAAPDEEVHAFVNDLERPVGTYLYGRRMYETMLFWETALTNPELGAVERDFAQVWQAADKIVFSRTLDSVSSSRTRIEGELEPDLVRRLKADVTHDVSVGGPELAAQALRAGLVDELSLFVVPVLVGAGKPALPRDVRLDLELLDVRRFNAGFVYSSYRIGPVAGSGSVHGVPQASR